MPMDTATPNKGSVSLNSSGSSISMDAKLMTSWAQEVRAELVQSDEVLHRLFQFCQSVTSCICFSVLGIFIVKQ